jgi:hypothetical protein
MQILPLSFSQASVHFCEVSACGRIMNTITDIRQQLNDLLATLQTDQEALAAEQAAVARATEALHEAPSLQAAIREGQQIMRGRVTALIDAQMEMLNRGGVNAMVLSALRQQVQEVEG